MIYENVKLVDTFLEIHWYYIFTVLYCEHLLITMAIFSNQISCLLFQSGGEWDKDTFLQISLFLSFILWCYFILLPTPPSPTPLTSSLNCCNPLDHIVRRYYLCPVCVWLEQSFVLLLNLFLGAVGSSMVLWDPMSYS